MNVAVRPPRPPLKCLISFGVVGAQFYFLWLFGCTCPSSSVCFSDASCVFFTEQIDVKFNLLFYDSMILYLYLSFFLPRRKEYRLCSLPHLP